MPLRRPIRAPSASHRSVAIRAVVVVALGLGGFATTRVFAGPTPAAATLAANTPGAAPSPATNPHWSPEGCGSCHEVKGGAVQPIDPQAVDRRCLSCHDGRRATAEAHPIGQPVAGSQVRKPADWPAPEGLLSCLTCHDVVRHCRADARSPVGGSNFLRGPLGGGDPAYCAQCHVESLHQRRNPHVMLDAGRAPVADACAFCHTEDLTARVAQARTGTALLRSEEITLCGACHQRHPDFFTPGHLGATFRNERCSQALVRNASSPNPLPVPEGRRIVCSTCHNPHERGVFPAGSPLDLGAMEAGGAGKGVPLRIPGGGLCSNCHGK